MWFMLGAPGSGPKKLSLPLSTFVALAKVARTEQEFRTMMIETAEIEWITPGECGELGIAQPAMVIAAASASGESGGAK